MKMVFGDPNKKELKVCQGYVDKINALEPEISGLSDARLRAKTDEFRLRLTKGETLDDLLPEAFAVVREAAKRVMGRVILTFSSWAAASFTVERLRKCVLVKGRPLWQRCRLI